MVLEGKDDYSLASERTKAYWKAWYKKLLDFVITKLFKAAKAQVPVKVIIAALKKMLKSLENQALYYVLQLYYSNINNLCTFFTLQVINVHSRGEIIPSCKKQRGVTKKLSAPGG